MTDNSDLIGRKIVVNETVHDVTGISPENPDVMILTGPIHREVVASHVRYMVDLTERAQATGKAGIVTPLTMPTRR